MVFKKIKRTEFATNVLTLMTGTAIAQAIPIAISPLLTRIYSPDDFGIFGLYLAIVTIVAIVAAGRYELAIMLPKKNEDAINILALSVILTFFVCIFFLIIILIFQNQFFYLFNLKFKNVNISEVKLWLYLIPFSVFFISLFQIFNYWSTRQKTFKVNAIARVGQSTTYSISSIGLNYLIKGSSGLIIGNLIGYVTAFFALSWSFIKDLRQFIPLINKRKIKENAITYKAFPIVNAPPALLSSMQDQGIIFIIAYYFTSYAVGCYSFTARIMRLPIGIIGSSMFQVFYQKASTLHNNNQDIRPLVVKIYKQCFYIGLPIFSFIFFTAPPLFAFVFGAQWRYAGEIAQILTPWLFLNFISSPISPLPLITNNQKKAMYFVLADFSLRIITLMIGGITGNFKLGLILMSISCSIVVIFAMIWYYKLSGKVNTTGFSEQELKEQS